MKFIYLFVFISNNFKSNLFKTVYVKWNKYCICFYFEKKKIISNRLLYDKRQVETKNTRNENRKTKMCHSIYVKTKNYKKK